MTKPNQIQDQVPLAPLTTIQLGGPARYFAAVTSATEITAVIQWARENNIAYIALGGGSNVIIADTGYDGLIIQPQDKIIIWENNLLSAGAGAEMKEVINAALEHNRGGLKFLVDVPGRVGGTVAGNAGGRDGWIGEFVAWVEFVDTAGSVQRYQKDDCLFDYRRSAFQAGDLIITRVAFNLPEVNPAQEKSALAEASRLKHEIQPLDKPSAGCMFRNVKLPPEQITERLGNLVGSNGTIPAWRLVDEVGLTGYQLGEMAVSDKHSNFLINLGHGTADQAMQLLSLIKQRVRDELNIQLHEEIRTIGF